MPTAHTFRRMVLVAAALAVGAGTAQAVQIVAGGHVGYGTYTQEDLNSAIQAFNARVGSAVLDEIKAGTDLGGHVGLQLGPSFLVGVAYGRLAGGATGSAAAPGAEVSVPADCTYLFFNWLPDNDKVGRIGLGVDAGRVAVTGFTVVPESGGGETRDAYEGAGLFLAGYVVADVQLAPRVAFWAHGGFRQAKAPDVDLNGEPSAYALDYSGAFVRAGLRLAIGGETR